MLVRLKIKYSSFLKPVLLSVGLILCFYSVGQEAKTLDEFLQSARANSPVLNELNNKMFSLKIDSAKLKADYGFRVDGIADAYYSPLIKAWGYGDNANPSSGPELAAIVRISRDFAGKNKLNSKMMDYNLGISQLMNQSKITIRSLNKAITEQYISTYASQQQHEIIREIIQLLEQEDQILYKLTQASAFSQTEYLSFKVTLQQNMLALKQNETEWQNNYALLNYLSGIVDTTTRNLSAPVLSEEQIIPFGESIYAESYRTDSLKLTNEAKLINYEYQPKVAAFADGGYSTEFISPYRNLGWSVGVNLSVPLYDGNKRKMMLQQKKMEQESKAKYNEFYEKQYNQQILQFQEQIKQYRQMIELTNEQMRYSKTLIEANLKQLPTGDVRMSDFILSINNYLNMKSSLVQYQTNLYNLHNNLHYLIIQ